MNLKTTYTLKNNIDDGLLVDNGFKKGTFKCFIHKDIVQLIVHINLDEKEWDYQIYDIDHDFPYVHYYNREFGVNNVVKRIDRKIDKIFKEFENGNIFIKEEDDYNRKNSKI